MKARGSLAGVLGCRNWLGSCVTIPIDEEYKTHSSMASSLDMRAVLHLNSLQAQATQASGYGIASQHHIPLSATESSLMDVSIVPYNFERISTVAQDYTIKV